MKKIEKTSVNIDRQDLHKLINQIHKAIENLNLVIKKLLNYKNI